MCSLLLLKDFLKEIMVTDRIKIDLDDLDDNNFKSCFARSMALNSSQRKHTKTLLSKQKLQMDDTLNENSSNKIKETTVVNSLRKVSKLFCLLD